MLPQYKDDPLIVVKVNEPVPKDYTNDIQYIMSEIKRLKDRVSFLERENSRLKNTINTLQFKR